MRETVEAQQEAQAAHQKAWGATQAAETATKALHACRAEWKRLTGLKQQSTPSEAPSKDAIIEAVKKSQALVTALGPDTPWEKIEAVLRITL